MMTLMMSVESVQALKDSKIQLEISSVDEVSDWVLPGGSSHQNLKDCKSNWSIIKQVKRLEMRLELINSKKIHTAAVGECGLSTADRFIWIDMNCILISEWISFIRDSRLETLDCRLSNGDSRGLRTVRPYDPHLEADLFRDRCKVQRGALHD